MCIRDRIHHVTGRVYKLGPYRNPKAQKDAADPLEEFERRARELGIDIEEET